MPTKNPFKFLDVHTNKGAAHMLAGMALGQGTPDMSTLLTTGVFVDRDTLEIGDSAGSPPDADVYEAVDISTDSTVDILTFWNNTDREIIQLAIDPADYIFTVGEYVGTTAELAIVTHIKVNSATDWDVSFYRGVAGTAIVAHATGTDAILVDDATALTAGAITVPMIGVTQAIGLDALAAIIGAGADDEDDSARGPAGYNGVVNDLPQMIQGQWRLINSDDVTGFLISKVGGSRAVVVEDAGLTNATLLPAATAGGANANANCSYGSSRVPTAAEVTAGALMIPCNFEPTGVSVYVSTTSTGAVVLWDGAAALDRVLNTVTLDNGGLVNWEATDTVHVVIYGNVDVADAAVIG